MLEKIINAIKDVVRIKGQGVLWNGAVKPNEFEVELSSAGTALGVVLEEIIKALKSLEKAKEEDTTKEYCCSISYPGITVKVTNIKEDDQKQQQLTILGKAGEPMKNESKVNEANKPVNLNAMSVIIKKALEQAGLKVWGVWCSYPDKDPQQYDVFVSFQSWKFQFTLERSNGKYTVKNVRIPSGSDKDDYEWVVDMVKKAVKDIKIVEEPSEHPANKIEDSKKIKSNLANRPVAIPRARSTKVTEANIPGMPVGAFTVNWDEKDAKPTWDIATSKKQAEEKAKKKSMEKHGALVVVKDESEKVIAKYRSGNKVTESKLNEQEMLAAKQRLEKKAIAVQRNQVLALGSMFRSLLDAKLKGESGSSYYATVNAWFKEVDDLRRDVESFVKLEGLTEVNEADGVTKEREIPITVKSDKKRFIQYLQDVAKRNRIQREFDAVKDNFMDMSIEDLTGMFVADQDLVDYLLELQGEDPKRFEAKSPKKEAKGGMENLFADILDKDKPKQLQKPDDTEFADESRRIKEVDEKPNRRVIQQEKHGNITLKLAKDPETDEYVVEWYENGKYQEGPTYYTNDKSDAIATMKDMGRRADSKSKKESIDLPKTRTINVERLKHVMECLVNENYDEDEVVSDEVATGENEVLDEAKMSIKKGDRVRYTQEHINKAKDPKLSNFSGVVIHAAPLKGVSGKITLTIKWDSEPNTVTVFDDEVEIDDGEQRELSLYASTDYSKTAFEGIMGTLFHKGTKPLTERKRMNDFDDEGEPIVENKTPQQFLLDSLMKG